MKKIKIKFYGLGYNDKYQAYLKIYDNKDNLIFEGKTYNSEIDVLLKPCLLYKMSIKTYNENFKIYFYTNQDEFAIFLMNNIINISRTITFLLTDYYYNLPIERGDLILWQKM